MFLLKIHKKAMMGNKKQLTCFQGQQLLWSKIDGIIFPTLFPTYIIKIERNQEKAKKKEIDWKWLV